MEIERLIAALEEAISYLRRSESSGWSNMPVEEIIRKLKAEVNKLKAAKPIDVIMLDQLFAPTGSFKKFRLTMDGGQSFCVFRKLWMNLLVGN